ncbi:MAG: aldo/keto reductase [Planctomycetota bacterium]|jgi:aryl-alcohol dehydrogenase-like predicted oxidoreductase|nr:aldo/keto reductase [Planctomycetota bacterium]MDP7132567.1 aldo/keto reductase [Planctomycetota bacterium]MDP7250247.1 aldo/keto reductase [Planctomycetota bacterium]
MNYRRFGKTEWQVSEIGMGGSWFYGRPEYGLLPPEHGIAIIERAFELGINYFDTAPLYGKGRSEKIVGMALKDETRPYYLATKVGYFPEPFDYTRDTVWRGFEDSLERLNRDSVDLIQIHEAEQAGWDGIFGKGMCLQALHEMKEQGLVKEIGLTGSDLDLMTDALKTGEFVSVITFLKYDMLVQTAKEKLIPTAIENDVAIILASPLHAGLLGSKRDQWLEKRFTGLRPKVERIEALLADQNQPISQLGLRYLLADANVSLLLSGVSSIEELEDSAAASASGPLPQSLVETIERA